MVLGPSFDVKISFHTIANWHEHCSVATYKDLCLTKYSLSEHFRGDSEYSLDVS